MCHTTCSLKDLVLTLHSCLASRANSKHMAMPIIFVYNSRAQTAGCSALNSDVKLLINCKCLYMLVWSHINSVQTPLQDNLDAKQTTKLSASTLWPPTTIHHLPSSTKGQRMRWVPPACQLDCTLTKSRKVQVVTTNQVLHCCYQQCGNQTTNTIFGLTDDPHDWFENDNL